MRTATLLLTLLCILGCSKTDKTEFLANSTVIKDTFNITLTEKLKRKPKIFLKFWSGMTYDEYFAVSEILEKEGIIKDGLYQYSKIEPTIKNDAIISITLNNVSSELYKLYQQKYNLPKLIKKSTITANYVENNPEYNPSMTYTNSDNVTTVLPMFFKDNSLEIVDNKKIDLVPENTSNAEFMIDNKYIIDNKTVYIKIQQEVIENHLPWYKYSLDDNKDIERYMNSTQGKEVFGTNFMGGIEGNCIVKNSKLRYVTKNSNPYISITYMSKNEYLKEKTKIDSEKQEEITKETEKRNKRKRVLNEI